MPDNQYTYAVARIRSKELSLLTRQDLEQMMSLKSYEECMRFLADKGWGAGESGLSAEALLSLELERTWALVRELVGDAPELDVFLYKNDYHNLKVAIKSVLTGAEPERLYLPDGTVEAGVFTKAVREHDFALLPEAMRIPAQEAYDVLLRAHDGQLCDVILDRAALSAIETAGAKTGVPMLSRYAELVVAAADIKIAVRAAKTGKPAAFYNRALAPCRTLDVGALASAARKGGEELAHYLMRTEYAGAAEALQNSPSAFEKWFDDRLMELITDQKSNPFTIGPVAAFLLARENEIKTVRILLSGKLNGLSETSIRERLREMYV